LIFSSPRSRGIRFLGYFARASRHAADAVMRIDD